ncbi:MAG: 4-alpha-glucanotransferase [Thermoanaerobacterales bacterium]|jgi:4-alpha-glucanotransferase|nr:4-alpha-glucanotransferase [Thermoanaerobacterales bacterium]
MKSQEQQLQQLAKHYGLETAYYDIKGQLHQAESHSLLAVLRCLGVVIESPEDVVSGLRELGVRRWSRLLEPVSVFFAGEKPVLTVRLRDKQAENTAFCQLELESGQVKSWDCQLSQLPIEQYTEVEGVRYVAKQLELPALPLGYHRFTLSLSSITWQTMVISAPGQVYNLAAGERIWGLFIPLYALRSEHNWGVGDFTDLETLAHWVQKQGGGMVGTLPLLSSFLGQPFDPSPYAPVSRLFWNELYLDVTRVPELKECDEARQLIQSADFQSELEGLRRGALVDYSGVMVIKRRVLERMSASLFSSAGDRRVELEQWLADYPAAKGYARFRAAVERMGRGWRDWPEQMQNRELQEGDYDPFAVKYHLYVQWLLHEQLGEVAESARQNGVRLYLDLPLGVHRSGFDTWWERDAFAHTASAGAPPDDFLTSGQNWGLPPLHPERIREQGYRYFISCLRNHFRYAGVLRLDHVMALHRLFWVPEGMEAKDGVYVRYNAREFYAILALESSRYNTVLVGEDLGTVPDAVRTSMEQCQVNRMYVLPFELSGNAAPRPVPFNAQACLNTHDMVPFASFWESKSPEERSAAINFLYQGGWITDPDPSMGDVLKGWLNFLSASPVRVLLINLEDLWLEKEPQNAPGVLGYPNWRRKTRLGLENLLGNQGVISILQMIKRSSPF